VLGESSRNIKARAAAAAGPAAPNNCVLCVLDEDDNAALAAVGPGGLDVTGGGLVVNSDDDEAVVATGVGDIAAEQIRVVGGIDLPINATFLPPAEQGGPPVPDPLADLPTPDDLPIPPTPDPTPVRNIIGAQTLSPGVYDNITVQPGATLTLQPGVYVVTDFNGGAAPGFRVMNTGTVQSAGGGVTIYLACSDYPTPCDGDLGTRFRLDVGSRFLAGPPTVGEYAGLSVFADPGNRRSVQLQGQVDLGGALYAASARLVVSATADVQVDSLLVVDRLTTLSLVPLRVSYDPILDIFGVGVPVLVS
jgi:hypothetical protein